MAHAPDRTHNNVVHRTWLCVCACGSKRIVYETNLTGGKSQSCGCSRMDHGLSHTKAAHVWVALKRRCLNPGDRGYKNYGGRGIAVCERWLILDNFFADMGEPEEGMSLDRIDNDKGYSPENCRWTTQAEQCQNTRTNKLNWEAVLDIRTSREGRNALAERYGVSRSLIGPVARNERWVDDNYIPPPKCLKKPSQGRAPGHYIGPARTSDKQEPNHDL